MGEQSSTTRRVRSITPLAWLIGLLVLSCGGAPANAPPPARSGPVEPDDRKAVTVYDTQGDGVTCARPRQDCPPIAPNREFSDACRLGGYRIVRCGCDERCTGKVDARVYDASGTPKQCAPDDASCAPAPAGAAFQDACTERGFHLKQCGCKWVCSGDPTK